ncbi:dipeptidyl peptidase 1-like [Oppia nitens]|uniref:dipeptidyl peptidase 1-like n=1 Tax=Oppia nitens TaxID=1686743 RepID=UPI0023DC6AA5|nr:dipeptidyl peptidase 1-like [Oppia nitens]
MKLLLSVTLALVCVAHSVLADTPANCTYEDIRGVWTLSESDRSAEKTEKCEGTIRAVHQVKVELQYPNVAVDEFGNKGTWTIIYNQGFEVVVNNRRYFAFSDYKQEGSRVTSICHETKPGWSHDVLGHNWACFTGHKQTNGSMIVKTYTVDEREASLKTRVFRQSADAIAKINSMQNLWTAKHYPEFEGKTYAEMELLAGGPKSKIIGRPQPAPVTDEDRYLASQLPDEFDWRNVSGVNYVSPVRNQGGCGSCFAFASVHMIESRLRRLTNNTEQVVLSPQDIVSCSEYSQGCDGGFPYLTAGKYAQDFGLTLEANYPYEGRTTKCTPKKQGNRYYTALYNYIGGFYGGTNEERMLVSLVNNGPFAIGFMVHGDFQSYHSGIYRHTHVTHDETAAQLARFNPFVETNHAVTVVGYGKDQSSGLKYWTVKNSWGASWGEHGYFRILRGTNECGMESIALEAIPIPN